MKTVITSMILLLILTNGAFAASNCDGSTLIINNKTDDTITLNSINETFRLSSRARGHITLKKDEEIVANSEKNSVIDTAFWSKGCAWGDFVLETAEHDKIYVKYDLILFPTVWNDCRVYTFAATSDNPSIKLNTESKNATPAELTLTISK